MPADQVRTAIVESMWGDEARAFNRLVTLPAVQAEGDFGEGDYVPDSIRLLDLPRDVQQEIIPPASPYSAVSLKVMRLKDGIALVLPNSRHIAKIFRGPVPSSDAAGPPAATARPAPRSSEPPAPQPVTPAPAPAFDQDASAPAMTPASPVAADRPDRPTAQRTGPDEMEMERLLQRAEDSRRRGDIMVTRLFLQRAARLGSRLAKYRLAQSYDPRALEAWGVLGVRPDPERAAKLYQEAGFPRDAPEQVKAEQGSR